MSILDLFRKKEQQASAPELLDLNPCPIGAGEFQHWFVKQKKRFVRDDRGVAWCIMGPPEEYVGGRNRVPAPPSCMARFIELGLAEWVGDELQWTDELRRRVEWVSGIMKGDGATTS